ncbi:MAG: type IV secretion system protein [Rickettsiales bacterium]
MIFLRVLICCLILFFTACEGPESCIEAGDFGNTNKARITVYPYDSIYLTSPNKKNECYPIPEYENKSSQDFKTAIESLEGSPYNRVSLLKYCLLGFIDYTKQTVGNTTSINDYENSRAKLDSRACYNKSGQDRVNCYEDCADGCMQLMVEPRWTSTTPSTETLKGIDIEPNTMISIKVKGQVVLGEETVIPVNILSNVNQTQPSWAVNSLINPNTNYNVKFNMKTSEAGTYEFYSKVILMSRKNPVAYADIASTCSISYLMNSSNLQNDPKCPVSPSKIGYLNVNDVNNSLAFASTENLADNNEILNLSTEDEYLVLQNIGTGSCSINFTVTNSANTEKYIRYNGYTVNNNSSFVDSDYYPSNNRLITIPSLSKLTVTSKTGCERIVFKKFQFKEINILESGFVTIKNITGQTCNLKARIINPNGKKCIKSNLGDCDTEFFYDNTTSPATEQISHFYEYNSNFNTSGLDPLSDISVSSSFTTQDIYVRKGQKIRILPETYQQNITFSNGGSNITKKCGFGMFFRINSRPALMCFNTANSSAKTVSNPSCKIDYGSLTSTVQIQVDSTTNTLNSNIISSSTTDPTTLSCLSTVDCATETIRNSALTNPTPTNGSIYCMSASKCAKVSCVYSSTGTPTCTEQPPEDQTCASYYREPSNPQPTCCSNINTCRDETEAKQCNVQPCCSQGNCTTKNENVTCNYSTQKMCDNCRAVKKDDLNTISKFISVTLNNCYDFSKSSEFSSYRLIKNRVDLGLNIFDDDFKKNYSIEDLKYYETYDGIDYGNLNSYEKHPDASLRKIENIPLITNQEATLIRVNNQYFNSFPSLAADNQTVTLYTPDIKTYNNGQNLEVVLCKESSSTSIDCNEMSSTDYNHASNITVLYSQNYSQTGSTQKNFIKINPNGTMERTLDFKNDTSSANPESNWGNALKCNQPASFYLNKSWFCFRNDLGNANEINKYKLTFRIKDIDPAPSNSAGRYITFNNSGKYEVDIIVNKFDNDRSAGIVNQILKIITPIFFETQDDPNTPNVNEYSPGMLKSFYLKLTSHQLFKSVVSIAVVMSISFYGLGFLMGVSEIKHSEIMKILFKIGFIYLFISPSIGWVWYNKFFVALFTSATDYLTFSVALVFGNAESITNKIVAGDYSDKSVLFASTDRVLTILFSDAVVGKVGALLFSSIFGWVYFLLMVYTFINYIYAIANTILLFITCQITTIVLLVIGPFFFIFLLFNITKDMFDNWVKALIGFSLQQIFLVLVISFFNGIIEVFLKNALGYRVCWTEVLKLNIILTTVALFNFWTVSGTNSTSVFGDSDPEESFGNTQNMPSLISFISLYIIVGIMKKFTDFFSNLAVSLAGGLKATQIGADAKAVGNQALGMAKGIASKVYSMTAGQLVDRADKFLFDSGKIADSERKAKMDNIKEMIKTKATLNTVGKSAVDDFKKKNALKLAGMSQAEQKKTLENVRNNAISNYAEYNGIKNVDQIMNMKGLNYSGTNVLMGAAQAARQAVSKDGALFNSANDKEMKGKSMADTSFSKDDAIAAMKSMNKEEKEEFMKAVENGTIHVNKGRLEQARSAIGNVAKLPEAGIKAISNPIKSTKAIASGISSGAKSLGKQVKEAVGGSDLKKEAIDQLKKEGKIDRFQSITPSFIEGAIRSKEDNKLINERMQQIAKDRRSFDEKPKITSSQVVKNLKSFSELDDAKRKSKTGSDIKASLKNVVDTAKNFVSSKDKDGKDKEQKRLDQFQKNQDFKIDQLNKNKAEIAKNGVDIKSPNQDQAVPLSKSQIESQLKDVDKDLKKGIEEFKKGDSQESKNFALASELQDKIKNRQNIKNDEEFMKKVSESTDKDIIKLAKEFSSATSTTRESKFKSMEEKAEKLVESRLSPELKEVKEYKKDLNKANLEIDNRIASIDKAIQKESQSGDKILEKIDGSGKNEKQEKLQNFIQKNEQAVNNYREKNIIKRIAVAAIPFKRLINSETTNENNNFRDAKKVLKEFSKVNNAETMEKFIDKYKDKINDKK